MDWKKCLLLACAVLLAGAPPAAYAQQASPEAPAAAAAKSDESASDKTKPSDDASEPRAVEWDDKIEAVLNKRYPQSVDDLKLIQKQTQRVIQRAMPAVVAVQVGGAFGSAVIVSEDGLVLTAGHVVGRPGQAVRFIFPDGTTARGKTLGMYREIDSGMMQITDPGPWPYVEMASAGEIETGQWVVAIGQPGGFDGDRSPPVRLGRVLFANDEVINTDCTLVGGDSGGPLFNMRGQVVGIHSRIGRRITDNFHVPISTYRATWERLVAGELWGAPLGSEQVAESRPLLGVAADPRATRCELTEVFPGMPAARAGVQVGDIVQKYNGKPVETFDDLVRYVYSSEPRDGVKLEIKRGDEVVEVEVYLSRIRKPLPGSADLPEQSDIAPQEEN